jgi:CRP-like cAMP-binding protein
MRVLDLDKTLFVGELSEAMIFQGLTKVELRELALAGEFRSYEADESIVGFNSQDATLYVIMDGKAIASMPSPDGENVIVGRLRSGDLFGETSIFTDLPHQALVYSASDELTLLALSRERLIPFINRYPRAGLKIFGFIIYSLINKLSFSNRNLAFEKECNVTADDLDDLSRLFPASMEDMLEPK